MKQINVFTILALATVAFRSQAAEAKSTGAPPRHSEVPPLVLELNALLHEQMNDLGNMETLRASYQSPESQESPRDAHVLLVRLNGPIQVVTESHTVDGVFLQKDYFMQKGKVYAHRVSRHEPTLDGKSKRVAESYFMFDKGDPIYRTAVTARVPITAKDPDLSKAKEHALALPPDVKGWGDRLTARTFDIARSFRPTVGRYAFGNWDQWLLKDAPPEGSGDPPKRDKDWLPSEDTLALPVHDSESPDGLFSIGWGYEKGPVNWQNLRDPDGSQDDSPPTFSTKIGEGPIDGDLENDVNFIMQHVTGKPIAKINSFYPGERQRFNHDELIARWSPTSACVVVICTQKWLTEYGEIAWIKGGKSEGSHDILTPLQDVAVEAVLKSKHPAAKRLRGEDRDAFSFTLQDILLEDDGSFEANVTGEIPKDDELGSYYEVEITGVFSPGAKDAAAQLKTTKVKVLPLRDR